MQAEGPAVLRRDDPADACETPRAAWADVAFFFRKLAQALGKPPGALRVLDPYYAPGGASVRHLRALGFASAVDLAGADFYAAAEAGRLPEHDVLATNPPFSGDHIRVLLEHCARSRKPFVLLLPEWVHRKRYFSASGAEALRPLALEPATPYAFRALNGGRAENTDVPCMHWARDGSCPAGDACAFLHGDDDARPRKRARRAGPRELTPGRTVWHVYLGETKPADSYLAAWRQRFGAKAAGRLLCAREPKALPA